MTHNRAALKRVPNHRTDGVRIACRSPQFQSHPVGRLYLIDQNADGFILADDDQVEIAIIVEIANGGSPACHSLLKPRPAMLPRDIPKSPTAAGHRSLEPWLQKLSILEQDGRLQVGAPARGIEHVSIDDKQVKPAIQVKVGKSGPESHERASVSSQTCPHRRMQELIASTILVQRVVFQFVIGHPQIGAAISVVVRGVDSHASLGSPKFTPGNTGGDPHFTHREFAAAQVQLIGNLIVGDVEIDPAILVQVCRDNSQSLAGRIRTQPIGNFGKSPIAIVPKQMLPGAPIVLRRSDVAHLLASVTTGHIDCPIPVDITDEKQVRPAIAVDIAPGRSRGPFG